MTNSPDRSSKSRQLIVPGNLNSSCVCNQLLTMEYHIENMICLLIFKVVCHIIISCSCLGLICTEHTSGSRRPSVGHTHNKPSGVSQMENSVGTITCLLWCHKAPPQS